MRFNFAWMLHWHPNSLCLSFLSQRNRILCARRLYPIWAKVLSLFWSLKLFKSADRIYKTQLQTQCTHLNLDVTGAEWTTDSATAHLTAFILTYPVPFFQIGPQIHPQSPLSISSKTKLFPRGPDKAFSSSVAFIAIALERLTGPTAAFKGLDQLVYKNISSRLYQIDAIFTVLWYANFCERIISSSQSVFGMFYKATYRQPFTIRFFKATTTTDSNM